MWDLIHQVRKKRPVEPIRIASLMKYQHDKARRRNLESYDIFVL